MSQKLNSDYAQLLNQVIDLENEKSASSSDLWLKMGVALEIENYEKEKIWAKVANDIEDNLWSKYNQEVDRKEFKWTRSGYFYRVGRKAGYILDSDNTEIALGQPNNSSINTKNSNMLLLCDDIINICRTIKEKSQECEELDTIFGEKEMKEFYFQRNTMMNNCKNAIDNKTKIPENTELFLLECLATVLGNTNMCGQIFQEVILMHMKKQNKFLTQKQASKFQSGGKQSKLYLLSPTDRDFALYEKYTGIRCSKCQSFRVRPDGNSNDWTCFDCDNVMAKQHVSKCSNCQLPLYKERLQKIAKTGKCPNCEETLELPQSLLKVANS